MGNSNRDSSTEDIDVEEYYKSKSTNIDSEDDFLYSENLDRIQNFDRYRERGLAKTSKQSIRQRQVRHERERDRELRENSYNSRPQTRGLTTATAIWVAAALGMTSGAGLRSITIFGGLTAGCILRIGVFTAYFQRLKYRARLFYMDQRTFFRIFVQKRKKKSEEIRLSTQKGKEARKSTFSQHIRNNFLKGTFSNDSMGESKSSRLSDSS